MKPQVTLLALAWLASGVALAQTPPSGGPPGLDIDRIALLLDLDDSQKSAVEQALKEQQEEMRSEFEAARNSGSRPSREEMQAKREQYQQELHSKLSGVLSDEQLKKLDALTDRQMGPGSRGVGKRDDSSSD